MSAVSSLSFNYDKDSFEEGTFEDISEISLEEVEAIDTELDENYAMEIERTRIIIPKYSANSKTNLKTLIEEQKNDEEDGLEKSDTEQEDEKIENDKNDIEEISRSYDENLNNFDSDDDENEEDEDNTLDEDDDQNENDNQMNNEKSDNENDNESDANNTDDDSDDMDIEMEQYKKLLEKNKNEEQEFDINEKNCDNITDSEDNSDTDNDDDDEINQINDNNSIENIKDNCSDELLLDDEEDKSDNETENNTTTGTSVELVISSKRPSSFNSDDNAYHLDFIKKSQTSLKSLGQTKSKNMNRNLSFSNDRLRDIERQNKILLQRILTKKPTYENHITTRNNNKNLQARRITSAAINRKKQQHQIDLDNQILKRKLEAIALRRRAKQ